MLETLSQTHINPLRDLCPALANKIYFNYGGQGPLPTPSLEAITTSWQKIQELGPFTADVWPYVSREVQTTRAVLAQYCGVPTHRLALTENVTCGCVLPLWGLPFSSGDRLLISDCEHPGVVAACRELACRQQLQIDVLQIKQLRAGANDQAHTDALVLEAVEQKISARTRLVVLSHLLWNTGQVMPIEQIAKSLSSHPQHPYLLVDAAQSFGQIPIEAAAQSADIYAFTGHKWSCGPEGLGGVALSDRVIELSRPTLIGWRSLQNESQIQFKDTAHFHLDSRRFEVATSCVPLMAGLRTSLRLIEQEGNTASRLQRIQQGSRALWDALIELDHVELLLDGPPPAGLVSFELPQDPIEVVRQLGKQGIWIRDLADPLCLRACIHITTEHDEIESLRRALADVVSI